MAKLKEGTISPAYGRDYKSQKEAEKDFRGGKDFVYHGFDGSSIYCSIRDFEPGATVNVRYAKLAKVCVICV